MNVSPKPDSVALPSSQKQLSATDTGTDEISLVDILRFLRLHFKVVGGVTIAAILLGLGMSFTAVPQARRELLLHLTLPPELTLNPEMEIDESIIWKDVAAAGSLALISESAQLTNEPSSRPPVRATLSPATDDHAERLKLVLTSEDAAVLETAAQPALNTLQTAADEIAVSYVEPEIARLDLLIQRAQEKIALLEARLATSVVEFTEADVAALSNLAQLQQQLILAEEFSQLADYELERVGLAGLQTRDEALMTIQVLMERQTQATNSLLQRLILSAIAGFMLGVLVAFIIDQLPQLQVALSAPDS